MKKLSLEQARKDKSANGDKWTKAERRLFSQNFCSRILDFQHLPALGTETLRPATSALIEPLGHPPHHVSWGSNKDVDLKLLTDQILAQGEIYFFPPIWFYNQQETTNINLCLESITGCQALKR